MAYDPLTTFTALQVLTSAIMNKVKDNFAALWPYSAAGDISYAASATTLTRLPKGTAYQALRMNSDASSPEWGAVGGIAGRVGGSATDWMTQGTTNYAPALTKTYVGVTTISVSSGGFSNPTITYPAAFSQKPLVLLGAPRVTSGTANLICVRLNGIPGVTTFSVDLRLDGTPTATIDIPWMAIGE